MLKKLASQHRLQSPLRSPIRQSGRSPVRIAYRQPINGRPVSPSPIRGQAQCQQITRQGPLSPIRVRKTVQIAGNMTPTRMRTNSNVGVILNNNGGYAWPNGTDSGFNTGRNYVREQFLRSPRGGQNNFNQIRNQVVNNRMENTIKKGVGLFGQLISENKIGSQRKQNYTSFKTNQNQNQIQSVNPFDYNDRRFQSNQIRNQSQIMQFSKQNPSGIMNVSNTNINIITNNLSNAVQIPQNISKMSQKSNYVTTTQKNPIKQQPVSLHPTQQLATSFGAHKPQSEPPVPLPLASPSVPLILTDQKRSQLQPSPPSPVTYSIKKSQSDPLPACVITSGLVQNQEKQKQKQKEKIRLSQITNSYEDIMLLLKKGGEKFNYQQRECQEDVKNSIEGRWSKIGFNMSPYI